VELRREEPRPAGLRLGEERPGEVARPPEERPEAAWRQAEEPEEEPAWGQCPDFVEQRTPARP
jgi:hypothetical protein